MASIDTPVNPGIVLTERAAQEIRGLLESQGKADAALRVFVQGGGCSGLSYGMAIDDVVEEDDFVYDCHGVKVVVDSLSIQYIKGSSIDYVEDVMGGGFKIDNPNAIRTCGCGSSFSTEEAGESDADGGCGPGCGCH
ncbi:Iron-sulfur cluster assembly accessory protein [Chthonomonas calidirosea]|uniref:Iron-sulfur cluster assembly accessory protein n=1 Tax=Chthonomonas calidirosea (strain DSM 23976 / ICMP 18418 / T49) TaxID=1303518 RepID=S0EXW6_CHTCT|nr:iron-sulfur cluster insertion protein ErpA [Chthonomonas calidirosea]CCW34643.1 Iron-sulfur cluster assembly accessory protein [Chthonomonas calidirosea T49]CEK13050.1 Iron-sulfur cluster assembly accessory protein [Chthonomonas calidirosea]CEK13051.1 Iron-sulfur cluster assembly accessory protein [Chthonomonas calidirosea]CEK14199.1 Iron-sulfur cluster assembly accessory protein [Chthonomonas calidirosea]